MRLTRFAPSLYVAALLLVTSAALCASQTPEARIAIRVVAGNGAINNIDRGSAFDPVVVVHDADGRPVAGAIVTFTLPAVGPGGVFADGGRMLMVQTDEEGRAAARGLRPNRTIGQFEIRVNASSQGRTATAAITQTNAAPAVREGGSGRKWAVILGIVGGAVAAGALVAAGGGSESGTSNSPATVVGSVTAGTPQFGAPR